MTDVASLHQLKLGNNLIFPGVYQYPFGTQSKNKNR